MSKSPIKSQAEADQVKAYLVAETAKAHGISQEEATKRVEALFQSGILNQPGAGPGNPDSQLAIMAFLAIPSEQYAHFT